MCRPWEQFGFFSWPENKLVSVKKLRIPFCVLLSSAAARFPLDQFRLCKCMCMCVSCLNMHKLHCRVYRALKAVLPASWWKQRIFVRFAFCTVSHRRNLWTLDVLRLKALDLCAFLFFGGDSHNQGMPLFETASSLLPYHWAVCCSFCECKCTVFATSISICTVAGLPWLS